MSETSDLCLVGLGLRLEHLTIETREALRRSRRALFTSYVPGVEEMLRGLCGDLVDLSHLYRDGSDRLQTYKDMAAVVLEEALEGAPVSALDCLVADLGVDIVGTGVQMHEATDVVLYRRTLLPELAAVLWQVGVFGTRLHGGRAISDPTRLAELRDHLLQFYEPAHPAILVVSSVSAEPSTITEVTIQELGEVG